MLVTIIANLTNLGSPAAINLELKYACVEYLGPAYDDAIAAVQGITQTADATAKTHQ